jgi:hypothetical protein
MDNKKIQLAIKFGKQDKLYPALVEELIRQRYNISQELAIHRQRDTKPTEFANYNAFCEECKATAKRILKMD